MWSKIDNFWVQFVFYMSLWYFFSPAFALLLQNLKGELEFSILNVSCVSSMILLLPTISYFKDNNIESLKLLMGKKEAILCGIGYGLNLLMVTISVFLVGASSTYIWKTLEVSGLSVVSALFMKLEKCEYNIAIAVFINFFGIYLLVSHKSNEHDSKDIHYFLGHLCAIISVAGTITRNLNVKKYATVHQKNISVSEIGAISLVVVLIPLFLIGLFWELIVFSNNSNSMIIFSKMAQNMGFNPFFYCIIGLCISHVLYNLGSIYVLNICQPTYHALLKSGKRVIVILSVLNTFEFDKIIGILCICIALLVAKVKITPDNKTRYSFGLIGLTCFIVASLMATDFFSLEGAKTYSNVIFLKSMKDREKYIDNNNFFVQINKIDESNVGDIYSTPFKYFDFLNKNEILSFDCDIEHELSYSLIKESLILNDINIEKVNSVNIIVGGGGLLRATFAQCLKSINNVLKKNNNNDAKLFEMNGYIIGVGLNYYVNEKYLAFDEMLSQFKLITIRDWDVVNNVTLINKYKLNSNDNNDNNKLSYSPCASSMLSQLDLNYEIKYEIGIYFDYNDKLRSMRQKLTNLLKENNIKYNLLLNNETNINNVIRFLGESKYVITTSYHGMHWATLLNKKVIIMKSWYLRFKYYKYKPVTLKYLTLPSLQTALHETKSYPHAKNESRYYVENTMKKIARDIDFHV